jgi:hypothetical protein
MIFGEEHAFDLELDYDYEDDHPYDGEWELVVDPESEQALLRAPATPDAPAHVVSEAREALPARSRERSLAGGGADV